MNSTVQTNTLNRPKKHSWPRRLLWTVALLLVVIVLTLIIGYLWIHQALQSSLPQLDGTLHIAGLSAPVTVQRDEHGTPHIAAASLYDLAIAQGYITSQDRLWQMDMLRRASTGELSEVLGPSLIERDKTQRIYGMRQIATRIYGHLPTNEQRIYDSYASGVNAFVAEHRDSLPLEFRVLHYQPRPWTGIDSLAVALNMVQDLDTHWPSKLSRERIAQKLHNPRLEAQLYPVGSWRDRQPTAPSVVQKRPLADPADAHANDSEDDDDSDDDQSQTRLTQPLDLQKLSGQLNQTSCDTCASGSNNWTISGTHTASGRAMLSNDMHLSLSVPNIWYMASLSAPAANGIPALHAAGVTLPGMPLVIEGHNEHVAWGITALYADTEDLYIEKLDNHGHYLDQNSHWQPLAHRQETIAVRGRPSISIDVQSTSHGPLLTPILSHWLTRESQAISLRWTLFDGTLDAVPLFSMNTASNWQEFSKAIEHWGWPSQNLVYSDDQGHIAYHAVGLIPYRPEGLVSAPIHDSKHEWQGYTPFNQLPNAYDPPSGLLATANSRVTLDNTRYPITLGWADPYRTQRIYKTLEGRDHITRNDLLQLQTDIYSEVDQELGQRFAYAIDRTLNHQHPNDERELRQAADLMRHWDGRLTTDSAAASLVTQTRKAFWQLILRPRLGSLADDYQWPASSFAEEEIIMRGGNARNNDSTHGIDQDWLPKNYADWDALLTEAVRKGFAERANQSAPVEAEDISRWQYGTWHVVDLEHPIFSKLPWLGKLYGTGPKPLSGDTTTVKQSGLAFGPSQRFTMDWSDIDASTQNITLGQSSNPLSPYYRDQWTAWYNGTTFALPFTPQSTAAHTQHTLTLAP